MKRIPRDIIEHLEYNPDAVKRKEVPEEDSVPAVVEPEVEVHEVAPHEIADIYRWCSLHGGGCIYDALINAGEYARDGGFIPTMPEFIEALGEVPKRNKLWRRGYVTRTEEYIGIDRDGKFVDKGDYAFIVVHGEGITADRIKDEYEPDDYSIKLTDDEFDDLLNGILPNKNTVTIHTFEEFMKKVKKEDKSSRYYELPAYYGIVLDYKDIKGLPTHIYNEKELMVNPLILARCGGKKEVMKRYFEKAMSSPGIKGTIATGLPNFFKYRFVEPTEPEGWLVEHNKGFYGSGQCDENMYVASVPAPEKEIEGSDEPLGFYLIDKIRSKLKDIF